MVTNIITVRSDGTAAQNGSFLSQFGRVFDNSGNLVFASNDPFLDPNDANTVGDVFLWSNGNIINLTRRTEGNAITTSPSGNPSLSGDGLRVAFESLQPNLDSAIGGFFGISHIYWADNLSGTTPNFRLVTSAYNTASINPSISADGGWIVYQTLDNVHTDGFDVDGGDWDIILHNPNSGARIWVSQVNFGGVGVGDPGAFDSIHPSVSNNGEYVVFQSDVPANVLVPTAGYTDTNFAPDIFLFQRQGAHGIMTLVSHADGDPLTAGNAGSFNPSISDDGRYIAYDSFASNLAPGDGFFRDVFLYDRDNPLNTTLLSLKRNGAATTADSFSPAIDASGNNVAFVSSDNDLVDGDFATDDIFVWERDAGIKRVSESGGVGGNQNSSNPAINPNGQQVAFESTSTNLGSPVTVGVNNVFVDTDDLLNDPIYRFFNPNSQGHFFTASPTERDSVIANPNYIFEGTGFEASASPGPGLSPVYRFFNPNSQGHFFTISPTERDSVIANPNYIFEGVGFYAYGATENLAQDIFRFFNPNSQGHFFTISTIERDSVIANPNYIFEGVGFEGGVVM